MNEERREEIRWMLADIIDNMAAPFGTSHKDFKREWLSTVAEIATEMVKE